MEMIGKHLLRFIVLWCMSIMASSSRRSILLQVDFLD
jgi:hypothetical protein